MSTILTMFKDNQLYLTKLIFTASCFLTLPCFILSDVSDEDEEVEDNEPEPEDAEDGLGEIDMIVDSENTTQPVDRSDEEWVKDAVLDVAYYLRAHKFNDFDRRYYKEASGEESYQYKQFPSPPLRYLHWEVYRNCDKGFYECLSYLQDTALKAELVRSMDTNVVMNERRWEYPRNAKSIEKLNNECLRLKAIDWRDADPFKGPLERFQWRVSASYYMCSFTMKRLSPLIMFGERCDNFASCLVDKMPFNFDPRADDSKPYQCAMYSFCPHVCCPMKKIENVGECLDFEENPCYWQKDRARRGCIMEREQNLDLNAMALNQWNVTCQCDPGYEWMSMFGSCVDIDECSLGNHNCTPVIQDCINLKGYYACVCAWGYMNVSNTCVFNNVLTSALASLHQHHHFTSAQPKRPFSLFHFLFHWTFGFFYRKNDANATESSTTDSNRTDDLINLNPD